MFGERGLPNSAGEGLAPARVEQGSGEGVSIATFASKNNVGTNSWASTAFLASSPLIAAATQELNYLRALLPDLHRTQSWMGH